MANLPPVLVSFYLSRPTGNASAPFSNMTLRLYNTRTRAVDAFVPLHPPRVTFYMCGPTVWNSAHIGNFRTFILGDLLNRYLTYSGFDVFHIMNITDVDDRLINKAGESKVSLAAHTQPYVDIFFEDRDYFRIKPADVYPRATECIPAMVGLVSDLMDRGLAYRADDGSVYFAVDKFASYGQLSRIDRAGLKAGARVSSDEYHKEDVRDFALWKGAVDADEKVGAAWDADFGRGRPGWHLECSAMALGEIGDRFGVKTLDIHGGGVDLTFPHHENEIAQSEGATGEPFVRHWLHGEFLTVSGTKMSKRFGNYLTGKDLREAGVESAAVRLLMFQTHYRQELNFSDKTLEDAADGVRKIGELKNRLREAAAGERAIDNPDDFGLSAKFTAAMDDDLNAPQAVAAVRIFMKDANRQLDAGALRAGEAAGVLAAFESVLEVLQIDPLGHGGVDASLEAWAKGLLEERQQARAAKDWGRADAIRDELAEKGLVIEDTPKGPRIKPKEA